MIRIFSEGNHYSVDAHLSDREAGTVLEYILDMMEERPPEPGTRTEEPVERATEILPEAFQYDGISVHVWVEESDCTFFTAGEIRMLARLIWLLRTEEIIPDLTANACVREDGARAVQLLTGDRTVYVEVPAVYGSTGVFQAVTEKILWLLTLSQDEAQS